jgi:hypothetical protein
MRVGGRQTHDGDMLTESRIVLVRSSFSLVCPSADTTGMLFYERIFTLAPKARALFGGHRRRTGSECPVRRLDQPELLRGHRGIP